MSVRFCAAAIQVVLLSGPQSLESSVSAAQSRSMLASAAKKVLAVGLHDCKTLCLHTRVLDRYSTTSDATTAANRRPGFTTRGHMYPLVPESLMAVWSDSKVAETAHVFGSPCSLWDREKIIYDRGNNGRWISGGPIREAAESGHQNYEHRGTLCLPPCLTSLFTLSTDSAFSTVERRCFTVSR